MKKQGKDVTEGSHFYNDNVIQSSVTWLWRCFLNSAHYYAFTGLAGLNKVWV